MLYGKILDEEELITVNNNKKDRSLFKCLDHSAIKFWLKYFFRRIMRIYPTYSIVLLSIVYIDPIGKAYYNAIKTSNLLLHLTLQSAEFIFWSIPPEMMYYLFIPIIVIGYVGITRMRVSLSNKLFGRPDIGAWAGRILGNIIIFVLRTLIVIYHDPNESLHLSGSAHYFLSGSICAIWYREIIRHGLLPLSLEEEKALENVSFVNACSWNLLCFSGKISFSTYLLHPIGLTIVNNYATTIGVQGAARETEDDEKVNDILDAVMLSIVVTIVLSWCFHKAIERPIMNFIN
ncbi:5217_t:CDS:2 [Dentiscutata heterogama]|uniref:5217_t:CDS:1 n=1 Tax=Dentiscutata heterogama TaxID=1316150 RepID=A0ACA9M1C4_9GLOM|nr:5217_t:CDS:2 [Dentiscutata heterogama]